MKPETKFWNEIKLYNKKNNCRLSFTRLENISLHGTPDLLVYNAGGYFFTVELKVTKTNKVRLSPHQIAFHEKHPRASFILVKDLSSKEVKLYEGSRVRLLAACGLELEACRLGLEACCLRLASFGDLSVELEA